MLPGIIILVVLIIVIPIFIRNGLISKKNRLKNTKSTIDVILKKRHDLIPSLVEAVQEYMTYEAGTLKEITRLRTELTDGAPLSEPDRFRKENELSEKVQRLQISMENYPDLKASENFLHLQRSLNEVEEQLSAARRTYNTSVLQYNNALEQFPSNVFARSMNLEEANFYEIIDRAEQEKPDIKKLFDK